MVTLQCVHTPPVPTDLWHERALVDVCVTSQNQTNQNKPITSLYRKSRFFTYDGTDVIFAEGVELWCSRSRTRFARQVVVRPTLTDRAAALLARDDT